LRRIVVIVGALLAGLFGLFMSVCGGGLLIGFGNNAIRLLRSPAPQYFAINLASLALPAGCLIVGVFIVVKCVKKIRAALAARDDEE